MRSLRTERAAQSRHISFNALTVSSTSTIDETRTIAAALDGAAGGQIGRAAGSELNNRSLNRGAARLDSHTVVRVQLEGIRHHGYVAKSQKMQLGLVMGMFLLVGVAGHENPRW